MIIGNLQTALLCGEEMCARDALEAVIGPQLPDFAAQSNNPGGACGGTATP